MKVVVLLVALACVLAVVRADGNVLDLTPDNFDKIVDGSKPVFVEFFAPWCGHCKNLAPEYEKVGDAFASLKDKVIIAKVDADAHRDLGGRFDVKGFPTLKFFPKGKATDPEKYEGGRTENDIVSFIEKRTGLKAKKAPQPASAVLSLTSSDFDAVVMDNSKDVLVEFFAPWCGHCKRLAPEYEKLGNAFKTEKGVAITKVDCDAQQALCSRFGVGGFPTLKFFGKTNKDAPEDYNGGRELNDLVNFINEKANTKRSPNGRYFPEVGRVAALDEIVSGIQNKDKDQVLKQITEASATLTGQDAQSAKFYQKFAETLKTKPDFIETEQERLTRMLDSGSVAANKVDEFSVRLNVLKAFA